LETTDIVNIIILYAIYAFGKEFIFLYN